METALYKLKNIKNITDKHRYQSGERRDVDIDTINYILDNYNRIPFIEFCEKMMGLKYNKFYLEYMYSDIECNEIINDIIFLQNYAKHNRPAKQKDIDRLTKKVDKTLEELKNIKNMIRFAPYGEQYKEAKMDFESYFG